MSLINEALKKAQRMRSDGGAGAAGQDGPVVKRAEPKSANSTLLLVVGGIVLVVASIVFTTMWLTRPTPRTPETKAPVATSTEAKSAATPSVVLSLPATPAPAPAATATAVPVAATTPPAKETSSEPKPTPATSAPAVADTKPAPTAEPVATVAQPAATTPAAPTPTAPAKPAEPDERIHKFVEALRVTGIRSSGNESKVLMNDRVYRVNDIVDRTLGVRLTKVASDSLTFTDANGAEYVKFF